MIVKYKKLQPWPTPLPKANPPMDARPDVFTPNKPAMPAEPSNVNDPVGRKRPTYDLFPSYEVAE
jgi:hypothetical protein